MRSEDVFGEDIDIVIADLTYVQENTVVLGLRRGTRRNERDHQPRRGIKGNKYT